MYLVRVSEEEQTGPVDGVLSEALIVKVTDDYGNGVEGAEVIYKVTDGDAVVLNVEPVTTDSLGLAGASVLLGSTEFSTVVACSHGLIDSLISFTVHAIGFVQIGGSVSYYSHFQPVSGVFIDWVERGTVIDTTAESGVYSFDRIPFGETVTLHPHKDRWKDVSLSTILSYDAALIARNAVGLETLHYYESLSADVDGDSQISMIDASQIARYVVGFELPAEVSIGEWRFSPDVLTLDPVSSTVENIDFTGFVMGDVHGGWQVVTAMDGSLPVPYRTLPSYSIEDSVITVDFVLDEDRILACDLVCEYDADIIGFLTMEKSDCLSLFQTNYRESEKGSVKIGMYGIHPVQNKDGVLHLKFLQKKEDVSTTVLLHDIFLNDVQKENILIELRTGKGNLLPQKMTLMQNFPNPFNGRTHIQFTIPAAAHVRLAVFNSLGQEVTVLLDEDRERGMHQILWKSTDAHGMPLSSGCYFYVLSSGGTRLIKKMEYIQ
jgi:hypothetical protein